MPVPAEEVYDWHLRPGSFARMTPPWNRIRVLERTGTGFEDGARLVFEVRLGPVWRRWVAEHHGNVSGRQFADRQVEGPFRSWDHTHRFVPAEQLGSELHRPHRVLAAGRRASATRRAAGRRRKTLERMFRFRHARLAADLERHAFWSGQPRLTVAINGAERPRSARTWPTTSRPAGTGSLRLVRRPAAGPDEVTWDPAAGVLDPAALAGVDADRQPRRRVDRRRLDHVASDRRSWRAGCRRRARSSTAIAAMETPPKVLVSASAVGAYGSLGGEGVTEETALGEGFLADVCRAWEAAAQPAAERRRARGQPALRHRRQRGRRGASPRCCPRSRRAPGRGWGAATSTGPGSTSTTCSRRSSGSCTTRSSRAP